MRYITSKRIKYITTKVCNKKKKLIGIFKSQERSGEGRKQVQKRQGKRKTKTGIQINSINQF